MNEDFEDFLNDYEDGGCEYANAIMTMFAIPKPFGMLFDIDLMRDFLEKRGYKIVTRHDEDTDDDYKVAVKPGDSLPDLDHDNVLETFEKEIQTILIKWLLKIGNE